MRDKRKELGLTQEDLGDLVGAPQSSIARLERGSYNPSLTMALRLAEALGSTVELLFAEALTPVPEPEPPRKLTAEERQEFARIHREKGPLYASRYADERRKATP